MIEVVILIFQSYGAVQQAVSLIILLSVFLLADIQASPYFSSKEQRFERFSLAIQMKLLIDGLMRCKIRNLSSFQIHI